MTKQECYEWGYSGKNREDTHLSICVYSYGGLEKGKGC
jgi:hypothetical protein